MPRSRRTADPEDQNLDNTNFLPPHSSTQREEEIEESMETDQPSTSEGRGDDPKAEEQRKISANVRKYKKLIAKIRNNKDLDSGTFSAKEKETMMELMREAQNLYKASNTAAELLYDAQVMKQLSIICRQFAEEMTIGKVKFNANEFANRFIHKITNGRGQGGKIRTKDWISFGQQSGEIFVGTTSIESLFSAFPDDVPPPPKERKPRRERQKGPPGQATKSKVLDMTQVQSSDNDTDKLVVKVFKQLVDAFKRNDQEAIYYFQFVVDPTSFGRTVENVFYVSFLVKEGKVKIFYDEETRLPKIVPVKAKRDPSMAPNESQSLKNKKQVIVPLTMEVWEGHVRAMGLKEPMIKR